MLTERDANWSQWGDLPAESGWYATRWIYDLEDGETVSADFWTGSEWNEGGGNIRFFLTPFDSEASTETWIREYNARFWLEL